MGKPFIDRTGEVYGRLTVIRYLGKVPGKVKNYWECSCSCGTKVQITTSNLATGHTQSCGCLLKETLENRRIYEKEHADEYAIWRGIKQRTGNKSGKNLQWYSNISLCDEWKESFHTFLEYVGKRPSKAHSIERLDVQKGYAPGNCVWATPKIQANNRKTNHILEYAGRALTVAQWSDEVGISQHTLNARIRRYQWTVEQSLTTPVRNKL